MMVTVSVYEKTLNKFNIKALIKEACYYIPANKVLRGI